MKTISMLQAGLLAALFALAPLSLAGEGHDHGDAESAAAHTGGPQRLPDGSVFVPKPAQRQMGVRTLMSEQASLPHAVELNGKVVMDPNAGGRVQAMTTGRIEPGPRGLPAIGQRVAKGQVLAYVMPAVGQIERSNQAALLAELRASRDLAEKRVARLRALSDTVPRKEIEAAESELASLRARSAAVGTGLSNRDALVAPVSGVIASAVAVAGQVVEAREQVFEVVDPARLQIEALAFDLGMATNVAGASVAVGNEKVALRFIGAARSLREQALPLSFRTEGAASPGLAVGQPVKVTVQLTTRVTGVPVPAAALMKNPSNQTIVWVKTAPERFEPRTVTVEPLDGLRVAVTSGLKPGERVVVQGATLVNQIR